MPVIRTTLIAFMLAGGLLSGAPDAFAADDEPVACADKSVNRKIKDQYEFADSVRDSNRKVREVTDVKDLGLGSAPISSLAPRPQNLKITSRYCQAAVVLDNGEKDTLYWRIDVIVQGSDRGTNYEHCSTRHDTFGDKCISYRERK
jgi:hypothetical protein